MCQHFVSSDVPAFPYYTLAWACLFSSPRSIAALYDAYFGFVTFFCWLRRREQSLGIKIVWFILIMALGNMAMSAYVFLQLFGLQQEEGVAVLFRQKAA